jgi:hypothetical protein
MDRINGGLLRAALLLAAIGSLVSLVRMVIATFLPIYWYWWGAVAFFAATALLAAAVYIQDRIAAGTAQRDQWASTALRNAEPAR